MSPTVNPETPVPGGRHRLERAGIGVVDVTESCQSVAEWEKLEALFAGAIEELLWNDFLVLEYDGAPTDSDTPAAWVRTGRAGPNAPSARPTNCHPKHGRTAPSSSRTLSGTTLWPPTSRGPPDRTNRRKQPTGSWPPCVTAAPVTTPMHSTGARAASPSPKVAPAR